MISEHIAEYFATRGIKQKTVAEAIGLSAAAMSEMLAGRRKLSADEYVAICDFLEVPYSRFIDSPKVVA